MEGYGLFHDGSVKKIFAGVWPTAIDLGSGYMDFYAGGDNRDGYSIFDKGMMKHPDGRIQKIDGHNEALYRETVYFFNLLGKHTIPSHFLGDMGNGKITVKIARIPQYDQIKPGKSVAYFLPLESVTSKTVFPISSLHRALRAGKEDPEKYGLPKGFVPGIRDVITLPDYRVRFSTKIEKTGDVYKGNAAMAKLAGLTEEEKIKLEELSVFITKIMREDAEKAGIDVADHKNEFLLGPNREFIVCDTDCTFDEARFVPDLSKQMLRNYYILNGYDDLIKKMKMNEVPKSEWPDPPGINPDYLKLASEACKAMCEVITREKWGHGEMPRDISVINREYERWIEMLENEFGRELC